MKKLIIATLSIVFTTSVFAQWADNGSNLTTSDNVGIGTASPETKLHIRGTPWTGIKIQDITTSGGRGIRNQYLDGNGDGWQMYFGGHYTGQPLRFGSLDQGTYVGTVFTLLDNGKVGIGTETPSELLEVNGNIKVGSDLTDASTRNETYGSKLYFLGAHNNSDQLWVARYNVAASPNSSELRINIGDDPTHYGDKFVVGVTQGGIWNPRLTVQGNGNIGIGTTSPSAKLEVDGNIISEEVKVQVVNPPDYVFSPDYSLRSLDETKAYITENQHLPEVPSAKEMEANGIQLGEMNMLLLKKIEELTLYQIELLERLETQNSEIIILKTRLQKIEEK